MMRILIILLLASFGLAGCVNLKPKANPVKLYSLGPVHVKLSDRAAKQQLHIARPSLPTYLESNRLQYRQADGEVRSIVAVRWAEPLAEGVARALAESLQAQASDDVRVGTYYPWQKHKESLTLKVQLHQFAGSEDGTLRLRAAWQVETQAGEPLSHGIHVPSGLTWQPGDATSLVQGLNAGLNSLAAQIASQL